MLFKNVMKILEKCNTEDLKDVLFAEVMLMKDNEGDKELAEACEFLNRYYHEITKCNRLDKPELIADICNARDNTSELRKLIDHVRNMAE